MNSKHCHYINKPKLLKRIYNKSVPNGTPNRSKNKSNSRKSSQIPAENNTLNQSTSSTSFGTTTMRVNPMNKQSASEVAKRHSVYMLGQYDIKVEKILKGSLNLIPSPSPSSKIQIVGGKVCLRCEGKTLLGVVKKLLKTKAMFCLINSRQ